MISKRTLMAIAVLFFIIAGIIISSALAETTVSMRIPSIKLYSCLYLVDLDYEKTNSIQAIIDDNWKGIAKKTGHFCYWIADHSKQGYDKLYDIELGADIYFYDKEYTVTEIGYGTGFVGGTMYNDCDIEHDEYKKNCIVIMTCTGIEHQRLVVVAEEKR